MVSRRKRLGVHTKEQKNVRVTELSPDQGLPAESLKAKELSHTLAGIRLRPTLYVSALGRSDIRNLFTATSRSL